MRKYYFEDFKPGNKFPIGPYQLTADEIIEFAREFDPIPFHLDEEAGKNSFLGGLAASGWHLCSLSQKMICDAFLLDTASQGSLGIEQCQWLKPVLAGDTIIGTCEVETARKSNSRPNLGLVIFHTKIFNQQNQMVMNYTDTIMIASRQVS